MKELPTFKKFPPDAARDYISRVLTNYQQPNRSHLLDLIAYADGHYRALFDPACFVLGGGQSEPSKSQWNGLKKKMKRHDRRVFIFRQHGAITTADGRRCCYVDFGFLAS